MFLEQCVDYIEGRLDPGTFEMMLESNSTLLEWLQSIVPSNKTMYIYDSKTNNVVQTAYNVIAKIKDCERLDVGGPKGSPEYRYAVHENISKLIAEAFPDIKLSKDESPRNNFMLCLDACPQYIGGTEIAQANIIGALLDEIPKTLSKTRRKRELKEKILKAFHIENKKYPRWNQEPEWPVYNGKPMKFIRTEKVNSEIKIHYFIDAETGFERSVFDAL